MAEWISKSGGRLQPTPNPQSACNSHMYRATSHHLCVASLSPLGFIPPDSPKFIMNPVITTPTPPLRSFERKFRHSGPDSAADTLSKCGFRWCKRDDKVDMAIRNCWRHLCRMGTKHKAMARTQGTARVMSGCRTLCNCWAIVLASCALDFKSTKSHKWGRRWWRAAKVSNNADWRMANMGFNTALSVVAAIAA